MVPALHFSLSFNITLLWLQHVCWKFGSLCSVTLWNSEQCSQFERFRWQCVQMVNKTSSFETKLIGNTLWCLTSHVLDSRNSDTSYYLVNSGLRSWHTPFIVCDYKSRHSACYTGAQWHTFLFSLAGSDWQSLSMCSPTRTSGDSPFFTGIGVLQRGQTGTWLS